MGLNVVVQVLKINHVRSKIATTLSKFLHNSVSEDLSLTTPEIADTIGISLLDERVILHEELSMKKLYEK